MLIMPCSSGRTFSISTDIGHKEGGSQVRVLIWTIYLKLIVLKIYILKYYSSCLAQLVEHSLFQIGHSWGVVMGWWVCRS